MVDVEQPTETGLSKEQKIGFVLLSAFAILAIGLGVIQIRNTMYSHFALNNQIPNVIKDQVNTVDALRFRDTDKDSLTDFDELYVYGTSPYLADTDSDGIPDGEEINRGLNPICAEGTDCSFTLEAAAVAVVGSSTLESTLIVPAEQPAMDLGEAIKDPVQVRKMLISAGVSSEVVNKFSDTELMKMITEIMSPSSTVDNIKTLNTNLSATGTKK
ncbi:MAG: hypothetical protein WCV83_01005 [Candidatus Magasanikbacteria bacterium]|jgi:hypothetical protein